LFSVGKYSGRLSYYDQASLNSSEVLYKQIITLFENLAVYT